MRVVLASVPLYGVDMPPLGLAYVAGKLREDGHFIKAFCFNSRLYKENPDKKDLWNWQNSGAWMNHEEISKHFDIEGVVARWAGEVFEFSPDVVGLSINTHSRLMADLLARRIKKERPLVKIIYGGPFCSGDFENSEILPAFVDVFVRGEGEIAASQVLQKWERKESLGVVKGIIHRESGRFVDNGPHDKPAPINELPFPALDLFNFDDYDNKREIPIILSRGCNYYCRFCFDRPMWGKYRMRSAENIVAEMKKHKAVFGRAAFKCNDLLINGDLTELGRLADLLLKDNLEVNWGGMARAREDMPLPLLQNIRRSGCVYFTFGIESGSGKILKFMGKPAVRSVEIALRKAHSAGIWVNTLWMVGHPRESIWDIFQTALFLFKNRRSIDEFVNVSSCYIPQGSLLHKQSSHLEITYDNKGQWRIVKEGNNFATREKRAKFLRWVAQFLKLYNGGIRSDN